MKRTVYSISALVIIPIMYYFLFTGFKEGSGTEQTNLVPGPTGGKSFVNCIFNGGIWPSRADWVETQLGLNRYNDLNFNTVHLYDYINGDVNGTEHYGEFQNTLSPLQIANTNTLFTLSGSKNMKFLSERCKISKLCYAQRVVYEVTPPPGNNGVNNGFCYQNTSGIYETDQGRTVLHACTGNCNNNSPTSVGYLAQNIYENMQHSDLYNFDAQYADAGTWYVKPMMRIDSSIVDNFPEKPVVKIVVVNFSGDTIKSVIVKAKHFAQDLNGTIYGGQYIDVFNAIQDPQFDLQVSGSVDDPSGLGYGVKNYSWLEWEAQCKVDFKVYWLGQVDVWFDKMTVDDKWANDLFAGNYDCLITDETNHEFFIMTALMVKNNKFSSSNYMAVDYVMNVMYNKLQNQAQQITLK